MYDKQEDLWKCLPIKGVAQASDFYLPKDEAGLSTGIEGPAIVPLSALRQGKSISMEGRIRVAIYMQFLMVRVPKHRRKIPGFMREIIPEESQNIERALRSSGHAKEDDYSLLEELKNGDFSSLDPELVDALEKQLRILPQTVHLLCSMNWRILSTRARQPFFTSDNPVCLLGGLGKPDCEVIFPLSSSKTLLATWVGEGAGLSFKRATAHQVRQINAVIREEADRFLFGQQQDDRISATKPKIPQKKQGREASPS